MNPAVFALRKRTVMVVMTLMAIGGGIWAFGNLGQLEDPNFTIKTALVATSYPGASPSEVEEEVTDVIEEAIQQMGQVKEIYSTSQEGLSIVYVDMKDEFLAGELPQIWDELRRKVNDCQGLLPPGAGPSIVNDDFGDVYGVYFALTGEGHSYAELKDYADSIKKELLFCHDVAKIDFWGLRQEVIYVEFDRSKIAELGVSPQQIYSTIQNQNIVQQSGQVDVDKEYMRITPTGDFESEQVIADLYVGSSDSLVRLGDIANIYRDYVDPPRNVMRFNGKKCIGIGISTVDGGNVVTMGQAVKEKLKQLEPEIPEGMKLNPIYYQSEIVTKSVDNFVINLVEAVVIVVVLLMLFMGWQSGCLIGVILLLTILCTFIGMLIMDIDLQKISLGALILALGMLVDNAIVVADGILVRVEKGESREEAAVDVVRDTMWPLLGATFVAVLAFAAIGFAPGNVGEFCRSLFYVMAISLLTSWVLAVTVTPLFCVWFLKIPDVEEGFNPYDKKMFRMYRGLLHHTIKHRYITVAITVGILVLAMAGFKSIPKAFFPSSMQRYFYVNYWTPQGTHISHTSDDLKKIERNVSDFEGVENVTTFVGEGSLRFVLNYEYESRNSSYGQLLVEVDDYRNIDSLIEKTDSYLAENYPDSEPYCSKIISGPSMAYLIEVRFSGPDIDVLNRLSKEAMDVMRKTGNTRDVRTDWRQMVRTIRPDFSETQARNVGVTRSDLSQSLQWNFNGVAVGLYREADELIPIVSRASEKDRKTIENIENVQVWSSAYSTFVPIKQVVTGVKPQWEWPLVQRRNRRSTVTVQCNPVKGLADPVRNAMLKQIEAIELPVGYTMEWGGEYEESVDGQEPLQKIFPICVIGMFVIVVWLFNSVRRPLIIFLTVPLSIIGVFLGLWATNLAFGFMSILGFLGLSGMLIKNAIVLIDQVELDLQAGKAPYKAILDSSVSRMRPVIMASGTTILGMSPLVTDPLYAAMAATIMGGLFVATFLTLIVVPVTYSIVYKVKAESEHL
ncbi:MAG: efflux RND transporter permease subunit [Sedimentisphaeraceae bacterium JB056]